MTDSMWLHLYRTFIKCKLVTQLPFHSQRVDLVQVQVHLCIFAIIATLIFHIQNVSFPAEIV